MKTQIRKIKSHEIKGHGKISEYSNTITAITALLSLTLLSATTLANNQNQDKSERVLEVITVTAEKRESNIQLTPISMSAFSQDALDARGINDITDFSQVVPTFQYSNVGSLSFFTLRGVSTDNPTPGGDPAVAFHYDGVYLGRSNGGLAAFWDVERVEVLRGPQGTLYGRNNTGGSINLITKKPTYDKEFVGDITLGNYDSFRLRGAANIPLVDQRLAARLSFIASERDGYLENDVESGNDAVDDDSTMIRGHLKYNVSDNVEALFSAHYFDRGGAGDGYRIRGEFPAIYATVFGAAANPSDPRDVRKNIPEKNDSHNGGFTTELNWYHDRYAIKSITSYQETFFDYTVDLEASDADIATNRVSDDSQQITQELQFLSQDDSAFDWVVGVFYFYEKVDRIVDLKDFRFDMFANENGGFLLKGDITTKSYAVFGQASYDLSETLRLTAGVRYSHDEKSADLLRNIPILGQINIEGSPSETWRKPTGKLGLDWLISDDSMIYFSASHGYKSGGMNMAEPSQDPFDPEFIDAYELGAKNEFFNRRLRLNAAVFYYDYQDLQVTTFRNAAAVIENAATATIEGFELDLLALPTENLEISATYSYMDATYDEFVSTIPGVGTVNFAGNTLNRAPENSLAVGIQYTADLGSAGTLTYRVDHYWQSEVFFNQNNADIVKQDSYNKTDASIVFSSGSEDFELEIFVDNLADEDIISNVLVLPAPWGNAPTAYYDAPRTFGLRVGYRY